ncbi:MAG: class II aldolase/adducin family protein [Candidatus Aenigmatarchaeota archaeon]
MKNPRIKFKVIFLKNGYDFEEIKNKIEELINWCNIFEDLSLTKPEKEDGKYSSGNLSFRASNDSFIITASCLKSKRDLNKDDFVLVKYCDLRNKIVYACGSKNPSSESMLHYAIYKNRKDINAIFHAHFPSKDFEERIRKLALAKKNKMKEIKIAFTKKEEKFGTISLVNSVLEILNKKNFIIMKNHGFLSLGKGMKEAGEIVLKLLKNLNYLK